MSHNNADFASEWRLIQRLAGRETCASMRKQLQTALQQRPDNEQLQALLADVERRDGCLQIASERYQHLAETAVDSAQWRWNAALCGQMQTLPKPPDTPYYQAPFIRIPHFMPLDQRIKLMDYTTRQAEDFVNADLNSPQGNEYHSGLRSALMLRELGEFRPWFKRQLRHILPGLCPRLGMPAFEIQRIEMKITRHSDGDFFATHQDYSPKLPRRVSFIYYFFHTPQAFEGGDLLLFDTNSIKQHYLPGSFTRSRVEDNMLLLFPSHCYHAALPIQMEDTHRFNDARFTVTGHITPTSHSNDSQ